MTLANWLKTSVLQFPHWGDEHSHPRPTDLWFAVKSTEVTTHGCPLWALKCVWPWCVFYFLRGHFKDRLHESGFGCRHQKTLGYSHCYEGTRLLEWVADYEEGIMRPPHLISHTNGHLCFHSEFPFICQVQSQDTKIALVSGWNYYGSVVSGLYVFHSTPPLSEYLQTCQGCNTGWVMVLRNGPNITHRDKNLRDVPEDGCKPCLPWQTVCPIPVYWGPTIPSLCGGPAYAKKGD